MIDVTPALHLKNEEYWIGYVLRDLFRVFGHVIMLDTGSTDRTIEIALDVAKSVGGELTLLQEDMGDDADRIGRCSTRLREMVTTHWMLLVDGDEIWTEPCLRALLENLPSDDKHVGMVTGRNIAFHDGKLMLRDLWSADRLFAPGIRWDKNTSYPFQSYGLSSELSDGLVYYVPDQRVFFWHTRHVARSSKDNETFFRVHKQGYFPYDGPYSELPVDWLTDINPIYDNPYFGAQPC
jgi:glycosyltransferase involved in cell wall biosynthesis